MVYSIRVSHLRSRYCLILSVLANFASRIEFSCIWTPRNGYETEEGIHKERKKERKSERKKYWRPSNFIGLVFSINLWMSNWVACNRQNVRFISSLVSTLCFRSLPSKKRVQVKKKFQKDHLQWFFTIHTKEEYIVRAQRSRFSCTKET